MNASGRNVRIVHLHEIHIHEERLGVLGVLLDVSDSRIGLPDIELMQIVVVDAGPLVAGLPAVPSHSYRLTIF